MISPDCGVLGRFFWWKHFDPPEEDECLEQRGAENKANCQIKQSLASFSELGAPWSCAHSLAHHLCDAIGAQFPDVELRVLPLILSPHGREVTAEELQGHTSSAPRASPLQVAFLIFFLFNTPLNISLESTGVCLVL